MSHRLMDRILDNPSKLTILSAAFATDASFEELCDALGIISPADRAGLRKFPNDRVYATFRHWQVGLTHPCNDFIQICHKRGWTDMLQKLGPNFASESALVAWVVGQLTFQDMKEILTKIGAVDTNAFQMGASLFLETLRMRLGNGYMRTNIFAAFPKIQQEIDSFYNAIAPPQAITHEEKKETMRTVVAADRAAHRTLCHVLNKTEAWRELTHRYGVALGMKSNESCNALVYIYAVLSGVDPIKLQQDMRMEGRVDPAGDMLNLVANHTPLGARPATEYIRDLKRLGVYHYRDSPEIAAAVSNLEQSLGQKVAEQSNSVVQPMNPAAEPREQSLRGWLLTWGISTAQDVDADVHRLTNAIVGVKNPGDLSYLTPSDLAKQGFSRVTAIKMLRAAKAVNI